MCTGFCDMLSWYRWHQHSALFLIEHGKVSASYTDRGVPLSAVVSTVCVDSKKPSEVAISLLNQKLSCQNLTLNSLCEDAAIPYPRFILHANQTTSDYTLQDDVTDNISVSYIAPYKAFTFQVNKNYLDFTPKGYFAVSNSFTWSCYLFINETISDAIPLISWISPTSHQR